MSFKAWFASKNRGSSEPVLCVGGNNGDIDSMDHLYWPTLHLHPASTGRDDEDLSERMCVPRAGTRREGDNPTGDS